MNDFKKQDSRKWSILIVLFQKFKTKCLASLDIPYDFGVLGAGDVGAI